MRNRRPLTLTSIGLAALLTLTSCGSDGESESSEPNSESSEGGQSSGTDEFCAEIRALQEEEANEDVTQADVDQFRELADRAPEEISDDLRVVADAFEEIVELGDTDDIGAVFSIFLSEDVVEAGVALEEFGVEECGLEPADAGDDTIDFSEVDGLTGDEFIPDVSGVDSPLYDDFFEPPVDPNVASLDGLKAHLDLQYTDADWRRNLNQFVVEGDAWEIGWSFGLSMNESALDICAAVASYLADLAPDATIVISELDDGTLAYAPVAEGSATGSCERV